MADMMTRRCRLALTLIGLASGAGCVARPIPVALDASERSTVAEAQDYLNGLGVFEAHFSQSGAFGVGAGTLWVARPGRLRVIYFGPNAQDMVAADGVFTVYDHSNGGITTMPVARTPLGLLLAPHISLNGTVAVTSFEQTGLTLNLTLQDMQHPQQGSLAVVLARAPLRLIGVTATDLRGRVLSMSLTDLDLHPRLTADLFTRPGSSPGS